MAAYRFTTTQLRGLHAAGRAADLQHALISALLARHLGPEYAGLFAEFEVRDSDNRDWFVEALPPPVLVASLPEDDQRAIRARAEQMVASVRVLADRIESQGAQGRNVARVLRDTTVYPPEDLWLYRGAPLILNWGYHRVGQESHGAATISEPIHLRAEPGPPRRGREAVTDSVAALSPVPRAPTKRTGPIAAALLWLVFALIVARLYGELLPACGIKLPFAFLGPTLGDCPVVAVDDPVVREGVRLQRAIEQAELDIAIARRACAPPLRRAAVDPHRQVHLALAASELRVASADIAGRVPSFRFETPRDQH